ncbi:uncharacterized protein LOC125449952 isoform X1 [Stegostoma tigrinum]|uniref:uncharacterized protein LOC125449952 isoform X1 n=1 Tax=Stegostoma tigrinum TaxID=3053191 RepID=UPI00286FF3A5|nr:uncharacterized protein LOC125449952 isoform X1 [Stegostoma tigrinum]
MFASPILLAIVLFHVLVKTQDVYDLPKPVVSLNPSYGEFLEGETTLVRCSCQCPATRTHSCYNSEFSDTAVPEGQCETSLQLKPLRRGEASYSCECLILTENGTWRRSGWTEPILIHVGDHLSQPTITLSDTGASSAMGDVVISCKGEIRPNGGIFYLYNSRREGFRQQRHVTGLEGAAAFAINVYEHASGGNYTCRYETNVNGRPVLSPSSQSVSVKEKGKRDRKLKGAQTGFYLYVGLACAAVIILLLALLWLIIIKKGRKKRQKNQRAASKAVQSSHSKDHDGIYDNANVMQHNTMGEYPDVHDNRHDGVTYAALIMDGLNQNESASVIREETCVYMDVKT